MNKYPRLGNTGKVPRSKKELGRIGLVGTKCEICGRPATKYQDVEFGWMRGDDGVYTLCDGCFSIPKRVGIHGFLKLLEQSPFLRRDYED